jgi:hypothetical protein
VNSRYSLESRRSKDADFNKLKGRNRPVAAIKMSNCIDMSVILKEEMRLNTFFPSKLLIFNN